MGEEGPLYYTENAFFDTPESKALEKVTNTIDLEDIVILSKEDYNDLINCKIASQVMMESANILLNTWLRKYTWCTRVPKLIGYNIVFKEMTKKLVKLEKSWFYKIWRKLHK